MFAVSPQKRTARSEARRQGRGMFSGAQRAGLDARQADQDRTLVAMHALEAALGTAAPGREQDWQESVLSALAALDEATTEEAANASVPTACCRTSPVPSPGYATGPGRRQHRHYETFGVAPEWASTQETSDFSDGRQRLGWKWPACAANGPASRTSFTKRTSRLAEPTWRLEAGGIGLPTKKNSETF